MNPWVFGMIFGSAPAVMVIAFLAGGALRDRRAHRRDVREMQELTTEARIKGWI